MSEKIQLCTVHVYRKCLMLAAVNSNIKTYCVYWPWCDQD